MRQMPPPSRPPQELISLRPISSEVGRTACRRALVINGPVAAEIGMNGGCNAFGSGNRANATIGRAVRLIMLNVGGGWPGDLDKSTLGHRGKYTYCVCENEAQSPWRRITSSMATRPEDSTVFAIAAEAPPSVTDHVCNDPEGALDTICSAMSTIASNSAVLGGHCTAVLGLEHARTVAKSGWTRSDIRHYLWEYSGNRSELLSRKHKYNGFRPARAAYMAAVYPAGPPPMMTISSSCTGIVMSLLTGLKDLWC
jgi:hypothetical protein